MKKGICYGVSAGPGDPELLTLRAVKIIENSDVIFLPSAPKESCRVYRIIQEAISKGLVKRIDEDRFVCVETKSMADPKVQSERYDILADRVSELLDGGRSVAFPALGEVSLYSTYFYVHERLIERGYESRLISGISSVQEICDSLLISLAKGDEEVHIFPDTKDIEDRLSCSGTKVFMKPKSDLDKTIQSINEYIVRNPGTKAYGISNCGTESEIAALNSTELNNLSGYMTVLIVK